MSERGLTAEQMRREFDDSFARPISTEPAARQDMLAIRADAHDLVVRTSEIAGILACPPLTLLPSTHPAFCGLVGVRGSLVAVYRIATLLGGAPSSASGGWLVLCRDDRSAGLLFDDLLGHVAVSRQAIHAAVSGAAELVDVGGTKRAVLSVPALLERIRGTARE